VKGGGTHQPEKGKGMAKLSIFEEWRKEKSNQPHGPIGGKGRKNFLLKIYIAYPREEEKLDPEKTFPASRGSGEGYDVLHQFRKADWLFLAGEKKNPKSLNPPWTIREGRKRGKGGRRKHSFLQSREKESLFSLHRRNLKGRFRHDI